MITRFISLVTGIVTLDVYLRSQLASSDPLFLVFSNNLAINVLMLILTALAISVSFRRRFNTWTGYAICVGLAAVLLGFGTLGIVFSGFIYSLWPSLWAVFLPLNYLVILQAGVVLGLCSLSYKHAPKPASVKLSIFSTALPAFKVTVPVPKKVVFPVPKIPQFPPAGSRQATRSG